MDGELCGDIASTNGGPMPPRGRIDGLIADGLSGGELSAPRTASSTATPRQ